MINPNQYSHRISILFNDYLQGHLDLEELIQKLSAIEVLHKQNQKDKKSENTLWFKFSKDDSLVTTINDLQKDLSNHNREFTLERFREVLKVEQERLSTIHNQEWKMEFKLQQIFPTLPSIAFRKNAIFKNSLTS